eukprot:14038027-Ditylum_brightwellii.AAC.1
MDMVVIRCLWGPPGRQQDGNCMSLYLSWQCVSPLKRAATRNTNRGSCHELVSAPPYGKSVAGKWHKHYKTKYQQHSC